MKNLIFIGMIGSGLKEVAEKTASELERKYVDTDEVLTRNTSLSLHDLYSLLPLDAFNDLTYRLAEQLSKGEDYVIAVGDSILKNPDAISVLKETAFTVYISQDISDITENCTDASHPLLARGLHRLIELFNERKSLYSAYYDTAVVYNENSVSEVITAYNANSMLASESCTDPALHAFFRYYIEKIHPDADSESFADECSDIVMNILKKYVSEENDNEH